MNQFRLLFVLLLFISAKGFSQKTNCNVDFYSFQLTLSDYESASSSNPNSKNNWYRIKGKSVGFGVSGWKTLAPKLDISGSLHGTFSNFPAGFVRNDSIGQAKFSSQLDVLLHAYATKPGSTIRPFLTAGLGAGIFPDETAIYAPIGTGMAFTFKKGARLLLQAQWRKKITGGITNDYLFYSIGMMQAVSFSKKKKEIKKVQVADSIITPANILVDTDGDGVPDNIDQCPAEKGIINGCPDNDNDGIINKSDACPDIAGLTRYKGCPAPDTDADGVIDEEDLCPNEKGSSAQKGCPEIKEEIKKQADFAAKNILFRFASSELLPASYPSLNELVRILEDNPTIQLSIEAHSDNVGTSERNQLWSDRRAKAVADYIISKGIPASRLSWKGYGDTHPIADNSTENGRSANRRVEFKLRND
jgi:outer membrane protein OmpA-like peptidoglycan-associated protein